MGVVVELGGKRIYHAGDTALFSDMRLIGEMGLDLALLPIGDHFTMGPEDALKALELLRPKKVVPIHYNTFPHPPRRGGLRPTGQGEGRGGACPKAGRGSPP